MGSVVVEVAVGGGGSLGVGVGGCVFWGHDTEHGPAVVFPEVGVGFEVGFEFEAPRVVFMTTRLGCSFTTLPIIAA